MTCLPMFLKTSLQLGIAVFLGAEISTFAFTPSLASSRHHISFPEFKQKLDRVTSSVSSRPLFLSGLFAASSNHGDESNGNDDEDEPDIETVLNDQREGMAEAFAALDKLTADDFDDLTPLSFSPEDGGGDGAGSKEEVNFEQSAKLYMDMQVELSDMGEDGVYSDILDDLASSDENAANVKKKDFLSRGDKEEETLLGKALDEAALSDADGIGNVDSSEILTTADVTRDVLNQDIQPSLSMEDFMTKAVEEAVSDIAASTSTSSSSSKASAGESDEGTLQARPTEIAATAQQLLQDEELRREIEEIFDRAGDKLRAKVEDMKKEQEAVTKEASKKGLDYLESEKKRLAEAEESVSRLIQKVAKETDEVQKAMAELERVKNEAGTGNGGLEDTALDLKKGGIVKQAALVGGLLFGSRAFTETILVLGSPNGEEHVVGAIGQALFALVCAAYFFLVK
mmetsp:Transcript_20772/g.42674  ORF Transcript_20772/g.42674 Transcript_20772/m.42674 type:complete len:456 (+) Transcript_20772:87-1454(+)